MSQTIYDFQVKSIKGEDYSLSNLKGKVILIVNTASKCGFTPQYEALEALYQKYKESGLEILAFPCNQFGGQEPGNAEEIQSFCQLTYHTNFPLFAKIDVNGSDAEPLYDFLKKQAPGILGSKAIKWNFTKFLVNKDGSIIQRFAPTDTPEKIESFIKSLL